MIVDHHMSICQTGRPVACAQCASRTEAPSNGLRKYHSRERHDGTTHSHVDFLNLIIEDYARATVVRACFLAAAFSDGSYLAHVNDTYLRHLHRKGTPFVHRLAYLSTLAATQAGPMSTTANTCVPYFSVMC